MLLFLFCLFSWRRSVGAQPLFKQGVESELLQFFLDANILSILRNSARKMNSAFFVPVAFSPDLRATVKRLKMLLNNTVRVFKRGSRS